MKEHLISLTELVSLAIRRQTGPLLPSQEILSAAEQQQFRDAVAGIRCLILEYSYLEEDRLQPALQQVLTVLFGLTNNLHLHRESVAAGTAEGENNLAVEAYYQYEYCLTLFYAWLSKRFAAVADPVRLLPPLFREDNRQKLSELRQNASQRLLNSKIPERLAKLMLLPVSNFLESMRPIEYREFKFLFFYCKGLVRFLDSSSISKDAAYQFLHEQGCNNRKLFNWQLEDIQATAGSLPSAAQRMLYYHVELQKCRKHIQKNAPVRMDKPTSRALLDNWLVAEIEYLQQKEILREKEARRKNAAPREKITLTLTVGELGCFVRLMIDAKIIKADTSPEVMRVVAGMFKTGRAEAISSSSLLKKSWVIETTTLNSVKAHLSKLLTLARQHAEAS